MTSSLDERKEIYNFISRERGIIIITNKTSFYNPIIL